MKTAYQYSSIHPQRAALWAILLAGLMATLLTMAGCDRDGIKPTGTDSGKNTPAAVSPPRQARSSVRVLLQENRHEIIVSCLTPARLSVPLRTQQNETALWDLTGQKLLYTLAPQVRYTLTRQYGAWSIQRLDNKEWQVLNASELEIRPGANQAIALAIDKTSPAANSYRGTIRLLGAGNDLFHVINELNMEDYLLGVVGAEAYSHWHIEALRAQCVASRTYALYWLNQRGQSNWDVRATQASQMYQGINAENPRVAGVVQETAGVVLAYGPAGKEKIFPAYYSAICGGHTQSGGPVFGESLKPLGGVECPYCAQIAPPELLRWKEVRIPKQKASELLLANYNYLSDLVKVAGIAVGQANKHGRAQNFILTGLDARQVRVRAEDLRLTLDPTGRAIQSSWFTFKDYGDSWGFADGLGWGHGVGLCQWGSQQMALNGSNCVTILKYYYPGATLVRAY